MNRRILILAEGATELRASGERWAGCAPVLVSRMLGSPPVELLSFETHTLSNFGRGSLDDEPRPRGEDAQARLGRLLASRAHGLVLVRDNDQSGRRAHGDRRSAIERGFAEALADGYDVPAVLALAIECIEVWALADPDAWNRAFGKVPTLPSDPEALWGSVRDPRSNHPKSVLRRCFDEIGRDPAGNAVPQLLAHASLDVLAARCPRGFGQFAADVERAFPRIECVVAAGTDRAIGLDGEPPWGFHALRGHVEHLHACISTASTGSRIAVVMGSKTFGVFPSLPPDPLRQHIVVTNQAALAVSAPALRASSFDEALRTASRAGAKRVLVLGGGKLYREALGHFRCTGLHYTRVDHEAPGADTHFADLAPTAQWVRAAEAPQHHDNGFDYQIEHWSRFTAR